jgi:plasmid maintenance system antidote protein VapI
MAKRPPQPIGELLRERRIETLGKGLREMAKLLNIAPAHLTDIEKGRRSPSEELLLRIAKAYGIDQSTLRAGWGKAQTDVGQIASSNATNASKAPELLRAAKDLDADQWDSLIAQARKLASKSKPKSSKPPKA